MKLKITIIILSVLLIFSVGFCVLSYMNAKEKTVAPDTAPLNVETYVPDTADTTSVVIVLDPGHGKSSSMMSTTEKETDGWLFNSAKGQWGEWRHWKSASVWQDCEGSGCSGRAPINGGCWYPIGHGDRDIEPDINLQNTLAAKAELERLGYKVRLTREDNNSNPSMTKRLTWCYPDRNTTLAPDADLFVCIHSNAGGGKGSCYISLSGMYDQAGIPDDYIEKGNLLGKLINNKIISETGLSLYGNGNYTGYPELILFCKSPVPIAYLEIGFYDNPADLQILKSESKQIGKAIAHGIDEYIKNNPQ